MFELLLLGHAQRELLAQRVVGDAGEFAQRLVDVLGPHADALVLVELQRLGSSGTANCFSSVAPITRLPLMPRPRNMAEPIDQWSLPLPAL